MLPIATVATAEQIGDTGFSGLHQDIIESNVLTRLDGPSLASAASCSTTLRHLSSPENLWFDICHSTWPSTVSPNVSHVISKFPNGGPRAFFSHTFPLLSSSNLSLSSSPPSELISSVDIHYKEKLIFSKVQETETLTSWFLCSPFRIDLLEPKDVVPTNIKHPEHDEKCDQIKTNISLSWILIDPIGLKAVNLSSQKPVTVQRHWLSGEVQMRFASIMGQLIKCGIVVTCGRSDNGEMHVREVSLEMEDMDGMHLNGKDSLVILHGALEGKKGNGKNRIEEAQSRYKKYVEMKKERKERKLKREGTLDMLCMTFGVSIFFGFCCFLLYRL